jgi:hypothetical protein
MAQQAADLGLLCLWLVGGGGKPLVSWEFMA